MTKKNKLLLLLLTLTFTCSTSCYAKNVESTYVAPNKSFVKIFRKIKIIKCKEDAKTCTNSTYSSTGSGSSVFINKNFDFILTAGHLCVNNVNLLPFGEEVEKFENKISVLDHTNTMHTAEIVYSFFGDIKKGEPDLCLLHVPNLGIPKLHFSKIPPRPGEMVVSMSAPMGVYHPPTVPVFEGRFSGKINEISSMATVPSRPGSSGGPVLNKKNKIVGVIFAVSVFSENITLITEFEKTKSFLQIARDAFKKVETKKQSK
tara:strand:- start:243 stop:1022 length:780 start_codon:yes stop_codon:yes gene_type:complete